MINNTDENFKTIILDILDNGTQVGDRTGFGTRKVFGRQMRFDMKDGFPMTTLKRVHEKNFVHELLWMLGAFDEKYDAFGNTNIKYLVDHDVKIWNEWPFVSWVETVTQKPVQGSAEWVTYMNQFVNNIKESNTFSKNWGELGPVYGDQWISFGSRGFNQIDDVISQLKNNPMSRRILVSAWNPNELHLMALPPCHVLFQFDVFPLSEEEKDMNPEKDYRLDLCLYQRSADIYLGVIGGNVPFYSLMLHMVAQVVNMVPGEFIWTGGDTHLYNNSIEASKTIITRESRPAPTLKMNPEVKNIYDFRYNDFEFLNYNPHKNIKVDVAI